MSKSTQRVTEEERSEINALRKEGKIIPKMASAIRRNRSTICREICSGHRHNCHCEPPARHGASVPKGRKCGFGPNVNVVLRRRNEAAIFGIPRAFHWLVSATMG